MLSLYLPSTVLLATVYFPPNPYSEFLYSVSDVVSNLVLQTDKVIIVGDFKIHVDVESDSLSSSFITLIDTVGFSQRVETPTHCCNHTGLGSTLQY